VHIDARFLPLSMRYVLTYVTPIATPSQRVLLLQLTLTTPNQRVILQSIQRVILQATLFELCRNQVEVSYFQLREDS